MMEEPVQDYPPGQHLIGRKIKIKGSPHSRDLDQVEVTTEKVEGTTVKTTEPNNQDRIEAKHPFGQPHRTTLIKTTAGWKEVLNQSIEKLGRMIDSPVLQADLRQYDYYTSSNRPTTLNMMARPNQGSGSESTHNRLNSLGGRRYQDPVLSHGLRNHASPMVRQIEPRINQKLGELAKCFLSKFCRYHYAPNHPRRIKGTQAERG